MEKLGIENLKLLIALPIEVGNIAYSISHDKNNSFKKWLKLIDVLDEVIDLFKINWSTLKEEYLNLDQPEKLELESFICSKFDIPDKNLESAIEKSIFILISLESMIKDAIVLFKHTKQ